MRYLAEYAWIDGRARPDVLIEVADGRFTRVEPGSREPATRLRGMVLPGLANVHSHAFHRALRGRTQGGRGSFWTWRELMYEVAGRLDPDGYFRLARAVYGEMALAGITAVGEFHYLHHRPDGRPYDDPNAMGQAVIAAAREAGLRITLLDTLYLHSSVDGRALHGVQRAALLSALDLSVLFFRQDGVGRKLGRGRDLHLQPDAQIGERPLRHRLRQAEGRPGGADQLRRLRLACVENRPEGQGRLQADRWRAVAALHAGLMLGVILRREPFSASLEG